MPLLAVVFVPIMSALRIFLSAIGISFLTHGLRYVLVALGVGFLSYVGIDLVLDRAMAFVDQHMSQLPSDLIALMVYLGVIDCIKIYFAAAGACLGIKTTAAAGKMTFSRNGRFWG